MSPPKKKARVAEDAAVTAEDAAVTAEDAAVTAEDAAEIAKQAAEFAKQAAAEAAAHRKSAEDIAELAAAKAPASNTDSYVSNEDYEGDNDLSQKESQQMLSDLFFPEPTSQPSLHPMHEAAEKIADVHAGPLQATSTANHLQLQQPDMTVDQALTSAAEEEIEISGIFQDESEFSEAETVTQVVASNGATDNWKKQMKDALEKQANKARADGKYYEFKGFFGRGTLVLAQEHQDKTKSQLLRRHTSTSNPQVSNLSAAAEDKGAMSENEAEINPTSEADIELLINYFTLLNRLPDDHPLPSATDLENTRGHFIFIPTQSGMQLIDLDKFLPAGSGGNQYSTTLQQARILGAVLSSIEHKEMFIIKKDHSISKEIKEAFSTAIGDSFHATLSNTTNIQRLFLKLLNYYLWYNCPKMMGTVVAAELYDKKLKELYQIINEIFKALKPIESTKLLTSFIAELTKHIAQSAHQTAKDCKPLENLDNASKIILDKLNMVDSTVAGNLKTRFDSIITATVNAMIPDEEEKEERRVLQEEKTGEPNTTSPTLPPGASALSAGPPPSSPPPPKNKMGGALKPGKKKRTKKRKSKMSKRKSKKHLKKAKKGAKTGKKVRFNLPSKKSKKKKTRKKR